MPWNYYNICLLLPCCSLYMPEELNMILVEKKLLLMKDFQDTCLVRSSHHQEFLKIAFLKILKDFRKKNMLESTVKATSLNELSNNFLELWDVSSKLSYLTEKHNDFVSKYEKLYSELQISRNCNSCLLKLIIQLQKM